MRNNFRLWIFLFTAILLFALSGRVPAQHIIPEPLSASEVRSLSAAENQAVAQTSWGGKMLALEQLRRALRQPQPAQPIEIAALTADNQSELGEVVGLGEEVEPSDLDRFILFIPDRIFDFLDMLTGSAGLGLGLGIEGHISRYFGLGLGAEISANVAWLYNRNLALYGGLDTYGSFGPLMAYLTEWRGVGLAWDHGMPEAGAHSFEYFGPFDHYDNDMIEPGWADPWGVGYRVGWVFFFWSLEAHPIEIADFITGFFTLGFIDLSSDDFCNPYQVPYKKGFPGDTLYAVEEYE